MARTSVVQDGVDALSPWRREYEARQVSADLAVDVVQRGQTIVLSSYGAEPQSLIDALIAQGRLDGVTAYQATRGSRALMVEPVGAVGFTLVTYAPDKRVAESMRARRADYLPASVHQACKMLTDGVIRPDVALVHVSPPDDAGFCSFGVSTDFASIAATVAPLVVAEVNDQMPWTHGESRIHVSRFHRSVRVSRPLISPGTVTIDDVGLAIGQRVAELIPDAATLQIGRGRVPDATLLALKDHRDLGIHSGLVSDGLLPLVEKGVITGLAKPIDPGLMVANQLSTSKSMCAFAARDSSLSMRPAIYVHDPTVIAQLDSFVALNSAIEVDLQGQANSEFIDGRQVSGMGGSIDFAQGAKLARHGRSVVALPSTAAGGRRSRIVPDLSRNPVVTLPRGFVDYVVTEYGIATLRGGSLRKVAAELISVAHPDFREELKRQFEAGES